MARHSMAPHRLAQHGTAARGEETCGAAAMQTELVSLAEKRCQNQTCVFSAGEPRAPTADGEANPDQAPCSPPPQLPLTPPLWHPQAGASPGTPHISGGSSWQPWPWQPLGVPEPRRHRRHRPTARTTGWEPPASQTQRDETEQQEGLGTRGWLCGVQRSGHLGPAQPCHGATSPGVRRQPQDTGRDWMRRLAAPRLGLWDAVERGVCEGPSQGGG